MSKLGKILVLLPFLFSCIFGRISAINANDGKPIRLGIDIGIGGSIGSNEESNTETVNGDENDNEGQQNGSGAQQGLQVQLPFPFGNPGQPAQETDQSGDQPAQETDQSGGQPAQETDQSGGQPAQETDQSGGQQAQETNQSGGQQATETETEQSAIANENGDYETNFLGSWTLHSPNSGVSAMHVQLLPNNKAIWFDTVNLGRSAINNDPPMCRRLVGGRRGDPGQDCTAHAIEYDIETAHVKPLKIEYDPWCSSGGMSTDGALISTGGNQEGFRALRKRNACTNCEFVENPNALSANRWYATQIMLENGSFVMVGGRGAHNYEIIPADKLEFPIQQFGLPLLEETMDEKENNIYPFVNLLPDGNIFIFANYKSIILNPYTGEIVRDLPDLEGGSRNYPASGMSTLLPIDLNVENPKNVDVEVMVCGGNTHDAFKYSELPPRKFFPAFKDCGRLILTKPGAKWDKEDMPSPRVMGDLLLLPTGDMLITNGAKAGTSAWDAAETPNLTPVLYSPNKKKGERFKELTPTTIPRMYHSSSAVLPNGQILIAGSNTNDYYKFNKAENPEMIFPTELRVEKFSPPYLAPELQQHRPQILELFSDKKLRYGSEFNLRIQINEQIQQSNVKVTMYSPPFTTHGYSMNQRLLILGLKRVTNQAITVVAPPSGKFAPPGYYLLFVVHRGVPSRGMWVQIN